jgi:hypothetical protein
MSSIQIPNLPAATGLNGTEQLEGVQSGASVKITTSQIATYISSAYPAPGIASITGTAPINANTAGTAVTISLNPQGVTNSFLAPMAAGTVKANVTVGSASPTDATVSQVLDVIGSTKGNILYRDTTSWAALTGGSNGQVLTAQGSTAAPIWATLSVPSGQIAPTGVVAGTYGSASTVPQYTVLASGQLSAASNVPIVIPYTSVTGLGSIVTQNASAVAITGGTINGTTIGGSTPAPGTFTTLTSTGATNLGTIASGVWNSTAIGVSYGGTGATTASGARSNLGAAASGANSDITSLSGLTTPLSETQGGTGYSSYTTGDILYANSSTTLARLNDVATGNALISGGVGVAPSWGKIGLTTHVSGTLPVANGGTGATTLTGYVYGNGTGAFTAAATIPNAGLTNSSVTIGSTSISLGGTATTLAGLTTVTLTQDPTAALQASTKQYVDNQVATVSNQTFHTASGYGTTANLTATYSNGTGGVGATLTNSGALAALTIDGYTFTATDVTNGTRVLVKDQTTAAQNGIYVVTNQGSGSVAWVLTRASDFNTVGTGPNYIETGASTFVTGGSANASTGWVMTATGTITVGSTSLTWTQTSSSSSVTVTSPLTKVGSVISLGTVPTTLGGTGLTTLTQYNVMLGNGTGNVAFAAPGTTGYPLLSTGASSNPAFGQLSLTAGVTGTLPVANGGTGTATAFTTGSVVFAGASGTYSQSNTKFFWDNTNNRLGINTGSPQTQLTVVANTQTTTPTGTLPAGTDIYIVGANAANTRITQDAYGTGAYGVFTARHARGTAASPTATQANDFLAQFTARGYGATAFGTASTGYIAFSAAENFTDTAQGTYAGIYTTPIGSNSIVEAFRFGPAGQLGIGGATYGTSGYVLTSGGASAAPTWSQVSATSLSGVVPVANGGTNISSYTIGDLIYASGTTTLSKLADIATGNVLLSGGVGVAPSYGKVGLTTHVSGTLPIANGGTALTSTPTDGQLLIGSTSGSNYALGTLTASTGISVTNGSGSITIANTGVTSLVAGTNISVSASTGGVTISTTANPTFATSVTSPLILGGTNASQSLTLQSTSGVGTTDSILFKVGNNGATTAMSIASGGTVTIGTLSLTNALGVASGGTGIASYTIGDLIYASGSTTLSKLADVATGSVLVSGGVGAAPSYSATPTVTSITAPTVNGGTAVSSTLTLQSTSGVGTTDAIIFKTASQSERMRIDTSGNVGIGVSDPATYGTFAVYAGSAATSRQVIISPNSNSYNGMLSFLRLGTTVWNLGIDQADSNKFKIANSGTYSLSSGTALTIDGSGNVGIGTASPGTKLNVYTASATNTLIRAQNTAGYIDFGALSTGAVYGGYSTGGQYTIGTSDGYPILMYTSGAERMRIDTSGNLLLGTTTAPSTTGLGLGSGLAVTYSYTGYSSFRNNMYLGTLYWNNGTDRMYLDASGNLTASGNVTAYSDARLKTNVSTIDNALALVEKMRGVRYDRIDSGKAGVGVIAQEMQEVVPEVVHEGEEHLSVAYGNLVGVLIEAVKELSARVKELEAK